MEIELLSAKGIAGMFIVVIVALAANTALLNHSLNIAKREIIEAIRADQSSQETK